MPDAALILDDFSFLPNVRVDDVMVSYAEPGGSVGPHLDSYDVFLIQGRGKRRWKWSTTLAKDQSFVPNLALRILEKPRTDRNDVLEPGDMLYLRPGFAHHGIAVTPCLTYSIGFRAPSAAEAWTSFANYAATHKPAAAQLLEDPPLTPAKEPGAIPPRCSRAHVRSCARWALTTTRRLTVGSPPTPRGWKPGHTFEAPDRRPKIRSSSSRNDQSARALGRRTLGVSAETGRAFGSMSVAKRSPSPLEAAPLAKLL